MKMKMSILLGVVHMNLGIVMSLFNNIYFKDRLSTICEFIPQVRWGVIVVVLLLCTPHACLWLCHLQPAAVAVEWATPSLVSVS
jgi:vacuolar-type H+-ATPase subunit I/STV1